jgi:two-component system cell cycle response regulator DivK
VIQITLGAAFSDGAHRSPQPDPVRFARHLLWRGEGTMEKKKILVVEDVPLSAKYFADVLDFHGYDVEIVATGLECVRSVQRSKPDLILIDIRLPDASGLDVTWWLKSYRQFAGLPVIAVTAMLTDEPIASELGCSGYLMKPVSVAALLETVGAWAPMSVDETKSSATMNS